MSDTEEGWHEAKTPAWVVALADQRLQELIEKMGPNIAMFRAMNMVAAPLTAPASDSPEDIDMWEHTCDNCGLYQSVEVYTMQIAKSQRGVNFLLFGIACVHCGELP